MTTGLLMSRLNELGVELWVDGEQLRYRAPRQSLSVELLAEIRERKAALIGQLRLASRDESPFPLTAGQRSLWFQHQANPGNAAYNIRLVVEVADSIDTARLCGAMGSLAARHPMLKTCFRLEGSEPVQWIRSDLDWRPGEIALTEESAEAEQLLLAAQAEKPFDLEAGPVCRITLVRRPAPRRPLLRIEGHHIAFDFASMEILVEELRAFYAGQGDKLSPLPLTYREYVQSEQRYLASDGAEEDRKYWRALLAKPLPSLHLAQEQAHPGRSSWAGATSHLQLDPTVVIGLRDLARREGTTLYTVFLAAYETLMFRYTHQESLLIGTPVSGRDRTEFEGVIGYFSNLLVVRPRFRAAQTFRSLVQETGRSLRDAMQHQRLPFSEISKDVQESRKQQTATPLVQTTFVWDQASGDLPFSRSDDPLYASECLSEQLGANYDLSCTVYDLHFSMRVALAYRTSLFTTEFIARLGRRFERLLESIVAEPETMLDCLELDSAPTKALPATASESNRLSFHQQRIWFIDRFETGKVYSGHPSYHTIAAEIVFHGEVDGHRLERALNSLMERHAILRSRVVLAEGGEWVMEAIPVEALATLRRSRIPNAPEDEIDPAEGPLLQACLHSEDGVGRLTLRVHHLAADAASVRLIVQELLASYEQPDRSFATYPAYASFAARQHEATPEELERLRFYWSHILRGELPPLVLPSDRPRAPIHMFRSGSVQCSVTPGRDSEDLLLAAFMAMLRLYSGQSDLLAGYASPRVSGFEGTVGPLSNLLVLRLAWEPDLRGSALVRRTSEILASAKAHGAMPFDRLVSELKPQNDMSRTALFDVLFSFHERLDLECSIDGTAVEYRALSEGYGKYDLHLMIHDHRAELIFNRELFDDATADAMLRHWERFLSLLAESPDAGVDSTEILDDAERSLLTETWNDTRVDWPKHCSLVDLFAAAVKPNPHAIAVSFQAQTITYRELDERANHLAAQLIASGVHAEELVAIIAERNLLLPIAILGVLKAGAAYLPLDPSLPEARIHLMLEDAGCVRAVMLSDRHTEKLPTHVARFAVENGTLAEAPAGDIRPNRLAYCIFTSGSTGQPKGVSIEHRQVVRLFFHQAPLFDFSDTDVWTLFHSAAFDFSVWELFGALLHGGRLVIVPAGATTDPEALLDLLEAERVTIFNQTPSSFVSIAQRALERASNLSLRWVIFGGQRLDPVKLKDWMRAYPSVRLVNMYGITETCVHVTWRELHVEDTASPVSPIGRPIPTTQVYVVDECLHLVPPGVAGELLVGGDGLARGYLNREQLTQQRFVPNPFRAGERVYRSGDRVRQLRNGELLYLDRADDQMQLRGYRVELGEVRYALLKQPSVADAWIAPYGDAEEPSLAAYVVLRPGMRSCESRLRRLEETLPAREWSRLELPNGLQVVQTNPSEVEFTYDEIFEERSYLRHGVVLPDQAVIFDVGANIGMFSLFAGMSCRNARIFAFEPVPQTYEMLCLNASLYDLNITPLNAALAEQAGTATFTYYPRVSIFSGRFADRTGERDIIRAFLRNSASKERAEPSADDIEAMLAERFQGTPVECELRTISQAIEQYGLGSIDLLKIDAEKSELEVLQGVDAADWPKIRQVVLEVHDIDGRVAQIESILRHQGFAVAKEQEQALAGTHLFNLFAIRSQAIAASDVEAPTRANPQYTSDASQARNLERQLRLELPDYMVPTSIILLDELPLTSNGKVDTARLLAPDRSQPLNRTEYVAPRNEVEERVVAIWSEILEVRRIGIFDSFFALGGHSLLVMRLTSRLRQEFGVEIPMHEVFQHPTCAQNAELIHQAQLSSASPSELDALLSELEAMPESLVSTWAATAGDAHE
jgi:syringomycin synthetase protein SyrE